MNKTYLLPLLILFSACNDGSDRMLQDKERQIDSLNQENARLKSRVQANPPITAEPHEITPTFVYAMITYVGQKLVPEESYEAPPTQSAPIISSDLSIPPPPAMRKVIIPSHYVSVKKRWFSPIKEYLILDNDTKYSFLDEAEKEFNFSKNMPGNDELQISKRNFFTFKSYAEASKDMDERKGRQQRAD